MGLRLTLIVCALGALGGRLYAYFSPLRQLRHPMNVTPLPVAQMTADQQTALLKLIGHYTGLSNDVTAARMAEIQSTLDQTFLAWYGPTTKGSAAYFRVTGPTLVIEYSPQGGGSSGNGFGGAATTNHIHGIHRDPTNDYGAKYTQ